MRKSSVRPSLTIRGRKFKGLRGWAGKPLHPPLTDFPVAAYIFAAVFDAISVLGGSEESWAVETAGDHSVWQKSETDVFPGQHD